MVMMWARSVLLPTTLLAALAGATAAHDCTGYDEEWGQCPQQTPCDVCKPVDCEFNEWGTWYEGGGCIGLIFRQRTIHVQNNECGLPCKGTKIQSLQKLAKECVLEKKDCALSSWSEWSTCQTSTDQSYRTRSVVTQPLNGGLPCTGQTQETQPCTGPEPVPCAFDDWQQWTTCSVSCGEGRHTRMRKVLSQASHNGEPCKGTTLETKTCSAEVKCPAKDCALGDWTDWSMCDMQIHSQRYRAREVVQPAVGTGQQCGEALRETAGCPKPDPVDCELSAWSSWVACDKSCDGGQTYRSRFLKNPMSNAGQCAASTLREAAPCATAPCAKPPGDCEVGTWDSWTECSAKCGSGSKTRKRKVLKPAEKGGQGCTESLEEMAACESVECENRDCAWSSWYDWSACSATCGGGSKRRTRVVAAAPRNGGALCEPLTKEEAAPCHTESCEKSCVDGAWAEWLEWSECSATCSSGFRSRRREVAQNPNECGKALSGVREEYQACADLEPCTPDVDCALSDWQEWSQCSGTCYGVRERNRRIATFAQANGKACKSDSLKQIQSCNPGPLEAPAMACTVPVQDATFSQWSEWSQCDRTCGGGQKTKMRRLLTEPKNGGATSSESLTLMAPCNTQQCGPVEPCVDCSWGQWTEWGECSKCGGQRWRHRSIERMNNFCGKPCSLASAKEVSNCTGNCEEALFCAWTKWSEPSGCGTGCGVGTTMRNRALGLIKNPEASLFNGTGSLRCSGMQLSLETCPNAKPCKEKCVPRNGQFSMWSEWTSPTCVGLCERERSISVVSNECGTPARGPLLETKRCEANCDPSLSCVLSEWGAWSGCEDPDGQSYRVRTITQWPTNHGAPCEGSLNQTKACSEPCEPRPCSLSDWNDWGACARTCGGGWQTRARRVVEHAQCGGELCDQRLEEMQMCSTAACATGAVDCVMGAWGSWSGCGIDGQRYRERRVESLAEGGLPCTGGLQETQTCTSKPVDCLFSDWTKWDNCSETCGGGQQHRQRQIHRYAANGGVQCPTELIETTGCNTKPCSVEDCKLSEWSAWDSCSSSCGTGVKRRSREVVRNRNPGGVGCNDHLSEAVPCDNPACDVTDCGWGSWSEWSSCTCSCGGGQRSRDRHIAVAPRNGGKACESKDREEIAACNTEPCKAPTCTDGKWSGWSAWAPCSQSCGGGTTFRTRKVDVMANECGAPASGSDREVALCKADVSCEESVDCSFSDWGAWSDCSNSCNGIKRRSRRIGVYGRGDGKFCLGGLKETAPCHPTEGGLPPAGCAAVPPVDCLLSSWTEWGQCSASCGGGEMTRNREILREPSRGGLACVDPLSEVSECGRDSCARDPKDCKFGDWQEWSACAKCDGERKRFRSIEQYPEEGGQNCEQAAHEEIGSCPRKCGAVTFCTWSSWEEWGACTAQCGEGRRNRRRYLSLSDDEAPSPAGVEQGLVEEFELLRLRNQQLLAGKSDAPLLAFACGCLTFIAAFASIRFFGGRPRRQPRLPGSEPLQAVSDDDRISVLE